MPEGHTPFSRKINVVFLPEGKKLNFWRLQGELNTLGSRWLEPALILALGKDGDGGWKVFQGVWRHAAAGSYCVLTESDDDTAIVLDAARSLSREGHMHGLIDQILQQGAACLFYFCDDDDHTTTPRVTICTIHVPSDSDCVPDRRQYFGSPCMVQDKVIKYICLRADYTQTTSNKSGFITSCGFYYSLGNAFTSRLERLWH